jgi:hypothetical protein
MKFWMVRCVRQQKQPREGLPAARVKRYKEMPDEEAVVD